MWPAPGSQADNSGSAKKVSAMTCTCQEVLLCDGFGDCIDYGLGTALECGTSYQDLQHLECRSPPFHLHRNVRLEGLPSVLPGFDIQIPTTLLVRNCRC
ncbi:uncharacterized protein METZ01_LOCUS351100 [marine metagenome]|uniref:Uncharacterized protein n=1 Tax=marine metagenome TaxID=408172 RepID=A0A382RKT5_9ZZZZ